MVAEGGGRVVGWEQREIVAGGVTAAYRSLRVSENLRRKTRDERSKLTNWKKSQPNTLLESPPPIATRWDFASGSSSSRWSAPEAADRSDATEGRWARGARDEEPARRKRRRERA